jgi:hypothetical protein
MHTAPPHRYHGQQLIFAGAADEVTRAIVTEALFHWNLQLSAFSEARNIKIRLYKRKRLSCGRKWDTSVTKRGSRIGI